MKELVINGSMSHIKKSNPDFDQEKLEVIQYGLEGLYILITKTTIILVIAALLGIVKELIIFALIYNFIRMPSFGLHATKSWICLVSSLTIFIGSAFVCTLITIPINIKIILGIILIFFICKNSPADTEKRPIINPKRRFIYKLLSTGIAIIFIALALTIPNNFLGNCFIFSLLVQCFMISPTIYKLFNLPYDNYKNYI